MELSEALLDTCSLWMFIGVNFELARWLETGSGTDKPGSRFLS